MTKKPPTTAVWCRLLCQVPQYDSQWCTLGAYFRRRHGAPSDHDTYTAATVETLWHRNVWLPEARRRLAFAHFTTDRLYIEKYSLATPLIALQGKRVPFSYGNRNFFVSPDPMALDFTVTAASTGRVNVQPHIREYAEAFLHFIYF